MVEFDVSHLPVQRKSSGLSSQCHARVRILPRRDRRTTSPIRAFRPMTPTENAGADNHDKGIAWKLSCYGLNGTQTRTREVPRDVPRRTGCGVSPQPPGRADGNTQPIYPKATDRVIG